MAEKEEKPGSWKELIYDFTQDTTLHGVRFTTRATPYVIRRILWILAVMGCLGVFLWFCYNQFKLLIAREKSVNVEVLFQDSVVFPTVTLCNQNFFKRSLAHKYGQHDTIVEGFRAKKLQNSTDEKAETVKDFDVDVDHILTGLQPYELQYRSVTVEVCKLACIDVVDDTCCSLLYNRKTKTCTITALEPSMPDVDKVPDPKRHTDYYRRQSCNIKTEAQCTFDAENTCNFQIDRSTTLAWKVIDGSGRGTRASIKSDHTGMSQKHFFLYASRNRQNARARLLSPYFFAKDTCVEFFHQIRDGKLKVYQGLRDNAKIVWKRGKTISTDWERGYVALPDGYIRVTIDAVADEGRVNIGLDDVKISKCKPIKQCRETAMGLGYRGSKSDTVLRKTCKNWDMVPEYRRPLTWNFESLNISHELNYCRNPDNDPLGLWCVTNIETMEMDYCDVPLCECRGQDVEFTCGNGRCIPEEQRCDTINDCGDLSDEYDCKDQDQAVSVNCSFQKWNCTYSSPPESIRKWSLKETRDGKWMEVPTKNKGRQGDFAALRSPTFALNQSACLLMRYNLSEMDAIDLFYLQGPNSFYREHICTLQGINHTYYEAGLDPKAPKGYNFSIDIPMEATNLLFIASSKNDAESDVQLYNISIVQMNCSDYFAPPTEAPTTVMTLNFTMDNDSMWWNATTETSYTASTERSDVTSEGDSFLIGDDGLNVTTMIPEITPIYYPECVGNVTGECASCLKDAFFWTRGPNDTDIKKVYSTGGVPSTNPEPQNQPPEECVNVWPDCFKYLERYCPGGEDDWTADGKAVQKNCPVTCGTCSTETIIECIEPKGIQCSFYDECICGYKFTSSNVNWVWKQEPMSNFTAEDETVALAPHADDNYLRVHNLSESSVKGDWIRLYSPIEDFANTTCLNFLYFSRYMDVKVFAYNETYTKLLLAITFDGQERHWHPASTNIQPGRHGVIFELTYSQFAYKNAGIDNVTMVPGLCESESSSPSINCTFESNDWCGYMDVSAGPRNWYRTLGTSVFPIVEPGNYFLRTRNINQGKVSRILKSPRFSVSKDSCLTFDFFDSAGDSSDTTEIRTFSITQQTFRGSLREPTDNQTIWRVFGTMKDENWHHGHANISAGLHYLLLEVNGDNYRVGIKNVTVTPGLCPEFNCSTASLPDGTSSDWTACDDSFFLCLASEAVNDGVANCDAGEDETKERPKDDDTYFKTTQDNFNFLQPEPDGISSEIDSGKLKDLYDKVGHQGEDLIYKCEWDGQECDHKNFTPTITDYGLCYTFNSEGSTTKTTGKRVPRESNRTGARFGLRLTLNIEEYEYMSGPNTDAGIKMFLHASDEEPQVRDLGFAISPGLHALVGIQRNTAINLPYPWGKCDDTKKLDYFPKYTQSACEVECETKALLDDCNCRDAYMTGVNETYPKICKIDQYFSCAVPHLTHLAASIDANKTDGGEEECTCPQPCNQTVYEPSLSYALLSTLSVDQILNRQDFDLEGNYKVALETVQRVNPDIFTTDMQKLINLDRAYTEMDRYVSEFLAPDDAADDTTGSSDTVADTIAIKLLQTVAQMRTITINDCRSILQDLVEYKNAFEGKFRANINLLVLYNGNLDSTYKQVKQILDLSYRQKEVSGYLEQMAEDARMWTDLARATIDVLDNDMVQNNPDSRNGEKYPQQYFRDENMLKCQDAFRNVKNNMDTLINVYAGIAEKSKNRNSWNSFPGDIVNLDQYMKDYQVQYDETRICINEYSTILNGIVAWLDTNTLTTVEEKNSEELKKQEDTIKQFESNRNDLVKDRRLVKLNLNDYATAQTEKLNFLKAITESVEETTLLSRIDVFQSRVQTQTVEPLKKMISDAKKDLEELYKTALDYAVKIDNYLTPSFFYPLVTDMSIWKLPLPNMEEPTNPYYFRETLELWKIWDQNMPLWEFVTCTAPTDEQGQKCDGDGEAIRKIKNALEQSANEENNEPAGYFKSVETTIGQFENDITASKQKITNQINDFNTDKNNFQKIKTIDETFIADNFMKVDVYFKQLKFQRVEQTKKYEILDFLSDVGGYLGLLLGASVLTLCEMIDLFLYNGVKKTLSSSSESNFATEPRDPEANGKAVPAPDSDKIPTVNEIDDALDGVTNYGMTDDRGFTSSQLNKA